MTQEKDRRDDDLYGIYIVVIKMMCKKGVEYEVVEEQ